jgi:hypothetical protein
MNCANILVIHSMPTYSHFHIIYSLIQILANTHQVTFLNTYTDNINNPNITTLFVDNIIDFLGEICSY